MSTSDPSGYLPPHELRALVAQVADRDDVTGVPRAPGPSVVTGSSPGVSPAITAPGPFAPTLPPDDPNSLAVVLAKMAGEILGTSVVPMPTPDNVTSGAGLALPASPGISPQLVASGVSVPTDPVTPQLVAAPATGSKSGEGNAAPSPATFGVPSGALPSTLPSSSSVPSASSLPSAPAGGHPDDLFSALGAEVRVPFAALLDVTPAAELDRAGVPPVGGVGAMMSPGMPPAPTSIVPDAASWHHVPLVDEPPAAAPAMADAAPDAAAYWLPSAPAAAAPHPAKQPTRIEQPVRPSAGTAFDPYTVRRDFPILEERVHGKRLVWLDNAATTQKPRAVIDRLTYYYEHENSNVHRAAHVLAARATDAFESARETTRKFLNAPSASEIIFVRGATEGINLIAKTWGSRNIEQGDEIVLTHLEHHANIVPWQQLCAEQGARLRVAPVDDRGDVILEELERLMCSRTKLVAFTQVSNALGTITPARDIIEIAHRWGAVALLDGAQAVSHMAVDVQALDCDFYVFSGHKVFAPTGIGAVFGKRALLEAMPPWQGGGNMIQDVTFEKTVYQAPPWRFEAGTGNIADAAGMGAALDYVMRISMATIDRYEHELLVYATDRLATVPGLRMIGTSPNKAGVLSFVLDGQRTEDVGSALDKEGIAVRSGHHCAQPILRRYGLESTVRASLAFYNVREDIDALVAALHQLQSGRSRPIR